MSTTVITPTITLLESLASTSAGARAGESVTASDGSAGAFVGTDINGAQYIARVLLLEYDISQLVNVTAGDMTVQLSSIGAGATANSERLLFYRYHFDTPGIEDWPTADTMDVLSFFVSPSDLTSATPTGSVVLTTSLNELDRDPDDKVRVLVAVEYLGQFVDDIYDADLFEVSDFSMQVTFDSWVISLAGNQPAPSGALGFLVVNKFLQGNQPAPSGGLTLSPTLAATHPHQHLVVPAGSARATPLRPASGSIRTPRDGTL